MPSISLQKLDHTLIKDISANKNLLDESKIEGGYYLESNGTKTQSAGWGISPLIPIDERGLVLSKNGVLNPTGGAYIVQYGDDGETVVASLQSSAVVYKHEGTKYVRFSINGYADGYNQIEAGTTPTAYQPYELKKVIKESVLPFTLQDVKDIIEPKEKTFKYIKSGTLASGGTFSIDGTELSMLYTISFSAVIDTFSEITIGQTAGFYYPKLKITGTLIQLINNGDVVDVENSKNHGLTIANTLQVIIKVGEYSNAKVLLASNGQSFEMDITDNMWLDGSGNIAVVSTGTVFSYCTLSFNAEGFKKDVWMFGDSYFGNRTVNREIYWLSQFGFAKNALISGYAGENSQYGLGAFRKYLYSQQNKPKKLVWCLGMNNPDSTTSFSATGPNGAWLTVISTLESICNENNIELILATIPSAIGSGGEVRYNGKKNEWVRESGYRYIDLAKAVGASDSDGTWFTGMLSSDGTHPTELGAKTLAMEIVSSLPEITI